MNGIKIALPVSKMSIEDLKYVERMTGVSLDEDKPLSVIKRNSMQTASLLKAGASIARSRTEYDCFNFFLACDIGVGLCETWFLKLMETFTPLFVRYNLLDSHGTRYFVKYRFPRRALHKIVRDERDCGTEWCLKTAKWALEASLFPRLRATQDSVLAHWFIHINDSQVKHHTVGPSKHEGIS